MNALTILLAWDSGPDTSQHYSDIPIKHLIPVPLTTLTILDYLATKEFSLVSFVRLIL